MKGATRKETLEKYGKKKLCNDCSFLAMPSDPVIYGKRNKFEEIDCLCQQFKGHMKNGKFRSDKVHVWKGFVEGQYIIVKWAPDAGRLTQMEKELINHGVETPIFGDKPE